MTTLEFGGNVKRTFCSICPGQCGVLVEVNDGKAVRIVGDENNRTSNGYLCMKGAQGVEYHNHPLRLNYPQKRVGARGDNKWQRITWEQALDEIAAKLGRLRDADGPETLATLAGTHQGPGDWATWRFCCRFGTPNFIQQGRNCGVGEFITELAMFGWDAKIGMPIPGFTKCAILWGGAMEGAGTLGPDMFIRAKEAGAKLIVVDPRRIEIARHADLHLKVKPRTDGALLLAMIHVTIKENLYDKEFVERWCLGFDEVRSSVEEWTPERASQICDVPAEDIVKAARMYGQNRPGRITTGVALIEQGQGAALSSVRALDVLRAISGNLDVLGGEMMCGPYDPNQLAWLENIGWDLLLNHPRRTRDNVNAEYTPLCSIRGYKASREAMAKVYPQGYTAPQYQMFADPSAVYRAVLEKKPYPIRAIICQGGEPLLTMGGGLAGRKAFTSPNLDLLVVVDHWMTPSAQLADYVLPAADFLERADTSAHQGCVNFFVVGQQCVEPQFERRNDYDFWAGLARRLGQDPADWPATLDEMNDRFVEPLGKSHCELAEGPNNVFFPNFEFQKYEKQGFATPSGKVELIPSLFQTLGVDASLAYQGPPYAQPDVDDEAAYPLLMIPGTRYVQYTGVRTHAIKKLKKQHPDPLVVMHPETAAAYGIKDGDWVYVDRPEGSIRQKAKLCDGIRKDTVDPEAFWWMPEKPRGNPGLSDGFVSNINSITPSDPSMSSFVGDQLLRGMRCQIRRAD